MMRLVAVGVGSDVTAKECENGICSVRIRCVDIGCSVFCVYESIPGPRRMQYTMLAAPVNMPLVGDNMAM